jgi:hypothetical protein
MPGDQMQLMTMFIGRVTPQDEARWRAALNRLGPEGVRARLAQLTSFDADEMVEIGDFMPLPSRQFVEAWLHRKDRTKRRINAFHGARDFDRDSGCSHRGHPDYKSLVGRPSVKRP